MNIVTFNIKNFKSNHIMAKTIIDNTNICFMIENWFSSKEQYLAKNLSNKHNLLFNSDYSEIERRSGRPFGGLCWFIDNNYEILRIEWYSRHLTHVEIKDAVGNELLLVGVWLPFDDNTLETWAKIQLIYSEIECIIRSKKSNQTCIILSDWNADPLRAKKVDRRFSEFINDNRITACEYKYQQVVDFTYNNKEYKSHIDHILCFEENLNLITNCSIIDNDLNLSDHKPLKIELDFKTIKNQDSELKERTFHRFPSSKLEFKNKYAELLDNSIKELLLDYFKKEHNTNTIDSFVYKMNRVILRSARMVNFRVGQTKQKSNEIIDEK